MVKTIRSRTRPAYPLLPAHLPPGDIVAGQYSLSCARSREELDAVLRLRFEVFNMELEEGLDRSYLTQRDEDEFDAHCHHLVLTHRPTGAVVGTYRMQTADMAALGGGFYTAKEFELAAWPPAIREAGVELGRACVARDHRNGRALYLLWKGLARYIVFNRRRYLFGCCSLTSQDPVEGRAVEEWLRAQGHTEPALWTQPLPAFRCYPPDTPADPDFQVAIPTLMRLYLEIGARICSPAALDREFKTLDYLIVVDTHHMPERPHRMYFEPFLTPGA